MSDTLASLRRKLNGAEQLGSVVRAMKAVAAASIGQYEKAVSALSEYQRSVELGLSLCLRGEQAIAAAPANRPPRKIAPIGALIFGSDRPGVGGPLQLEVIGDFALETLRKLPGPKTVWAVGERVLLVASKGPVWASRSDSPYRRLGRRHHGARRRNADRN